jgi:hypothetical protein
LTRGGYPFEKSCHALLKLRYNGDGRFAPRNASMAKSQKKTSGEVRKPKAEKAPKQNASQPSQKAGVVKGLENFNN